MIDRSLNYGRHLIEKFLVQAGEYHSVLDIGAGSGDDLLLARKLQPEATLYAVEIFEDYANKLKEKNIVVTSLNIERDRFPFPDNSIQVVIANQILEHTKEIFWIFHEISRVLPVSGKLIMGVPNLAALHNRILLALGKQPTPIKSNSAHLRGFTKGDVLRFLHACFPGGYTLKAFGGSNFYPFNPMIAQRLASFFPSLAWGIFFMLEKQRAYGSEFLDYPSVHKLETNFYCGE